jgi:intracellular multiplication protein IcmB
MEVLSKLLMSIDAIKEQISAKNKKHADDYYEVVSPLNDHTFKMNDGTMLSFFRLQGFSRILSTHEKRKATKMIEGQLEAFITKPGHTFQIVEVSDPETTESTVRESMGASIEELKAIGIDHPLFGEEYIKFIAERTVWKQQYLVLMSSPRTVKKDFTPSKMTPEQKSSLEERDQILRKVLSVELMEQGVFLTEKEKWTLDHHHSFQKEATSALTLAGSIVTPLTVTRAVKMQKKSLYGGEAAGNFKPVFQGMKVEQKQQAGTDNRVRLSLPSLTEQVIHQGGTEEGVPADCFQMGDRFFSTISMTIPQMDDGLKDYSFLATKIEKEVGYISSMRLATQPFDESSYKVERLYTTLSSILPGTDNALIKRSRDEMESQHKQRVKTYVAMQMSITLHAKDLETLQRNRRNLLNSIPAWGLAQFRTVELDKTQGLFDTLPGMSKRGHLKQVFESFDEALFQSPLFIEGQLFNRGYLHFFTDSGQPFPFEEHSSLSLNFNSYMCGTSGAGKSTLLTVTNLALLAKPKINERLKGELPIIFDVDFGKTSFGFKDTIRTLVSDDKRHQFLMHEMTTEEDSSINPHDLPLGRTRPTMRHKEVLTRFLLVLLGGASKNNSGAMTLSAPELEPMIKYMIDAVYEFRSEDHSPRMFEPAAFRHPAIMKKLKSYGIEPNEHFSYYQLADELMKKSAGKATRYSSIIRRYAMPRLGDYSKLLSQRAELAARFDQGNVGGGLTPLKFFTTKLAEVIHEYPCFSQVTKVPLDAARMISLDIKNVCGESITRKAVFGSMCFMAFLVKRENLEESPDLLSKVDKIYHPYLNNLSRMNTQLPGSLNIEEAHVLFELFNDSLITNKRQNRKAGWGIKSLSQNLVDPSDELFKICGSVFITSNQVGDDVDKRLNLMNASVQEKYLINEKLVSRRFFLYLQTRPTPTGVQVDRVGVSLRALLPPFLIWASQNDQTDIAFKKDVLAAVGPKDGFERLCSFFPGGSVKGYFTDDRFIELASERGEKSVYTMLFNEISEREHPSNWLKSLLR